MTVLAINAVVIDETIDMSKATRIPGQFSIDTIEAAASREKNPKPTAKRDMPLSTATCEINRISMHSNMIDAVVLPARRRRGAISW